MHSYVDDSFWTPHVLQSDIVTECPLLYQYVCIRTGEVHVYTVRVQEK